MPENHNAIRGSFTHLLRDCQPDDQEILVADADNWRIMNRCFIAWNASKTEADLPNRSLSGVDVKSTSRQKDGWSVNLGGSVGIQAKAGTGIRQHTYGNFAVWSVASARVATEQPEFCAGVTVSDDSGTLFPVLPHNCKYFRVLARNSAEDEEIQLSEFVLTGFRIPLIKHQEINLSK